MTWKFAAVLIGLALSAAQGWAQDVTIPADPPGKVLPVIRPGTPYMPTGAPPSIFGDGSSTITHHPAQVVVRGQLLCVEYSSLCLAPPPGWKLVEEGNGK